MIALGVKLIDFDELCDAVCRGRMGKRSYVLSSFGKALKECSLNYTDDNMRCYRLSYEALEPLGIAEAMPINNIDKLF